MGNDNKNTNSSYNDKFESMDISESENNVKITDEKIHISVNKSTLVLSAILCVAVVLIAIFAILYFTTMREKRYFENSISTQAVTETVAPTQAPTEAPTQKPTEKKKKSSKPKETTPATPAFNSYTIALHATTSVYSGPGYEYDFVMKIDEDGVFTIVDECINPTTGVSWGKLKSGVGWVNTSAAHFYNTYDYKTPVSKADNIVPYTVTVYAQTAVYSGPSFSHDYVMTIEEQGVYTIVEEHYDPYNVCTWGKLKSGVGWINLG